MRLFTERGMYMPRLPHHPPARPRPWVVSNWLLVAGWANVLPKAAAVIRAFAPTTSYVAGRKLMKAVTTRQRPATPPVAAPAAGLFRTEHIAGAVRRAKPIKCAAMVPVRISKMTRTTAARAAGSVLDGKLARRVTVVIQRERLL